MLKSRTSRSKYIPVAVGIFTGNAQQPLNFKSLAEVKRQIEVVEAQGYGYSLFCYEYTFSFLRFVNTNTKESFFDDSQR